MTSRQARDEARPAPGPEESSSIAPVDGPTLSRPPIEVAASESAEDAEARYVTARDAWTAAMRLAASGKPADLASLAIAQEAYEAAVRERELWASGARVAVPVTAQPARTAIDIVVGQEFAWRRVHREDEEPAPGFLGRLRRRIRRR